MKHFISILSVILLLGLSLTVGNGPYGTTETDTLAGIESPVYNSPSFTLDNTEASSIMEISAIQLSTPIFIEDDFRPDTQGILNKRDDTQEPVIIVVRLAHYKQSYKSIFIEPDNYG